VIGMIGKILNTSKNRDKLLLNLVRNKQRLHQITMLKKRKRKARKRKEIT